MPSTRRRAFLKASGIAGVTTLTGLAGCTLANNGGGSDGGSGSSGGGSGGGGGGSGGGGGGSGGGNGSGSSGSGGGNSNPVTVAATIPKTGQFSAVGKDLLRGYELGVQRMNDNDVLGRGVELITKDDKSNPKTVRERLTQMISNNDVDMIWSSFADLLIGNEVQVAEQRGIPLVAVAQSNANLHTENDTKWLFSPFPQTSDHVAATKAVLDGIPKAKRPTRVGLWVPNEEWSVRMADAWEETLSGDYEIVLREKHQEGASDFSTLISKTQSANVEVLLGTETPPGGITAMKQLSNADYTPTFQEFIRAADTSSWHSALGKKGQHVCMGPGWVPGLTSNGNDQLEQSYRKKYGLESGQTIPVMTGAGYNATQTAEQALKAAGSVDKATVQKALRNGTFKTVSGEFSFDDVGRPENFTSPVGQWQDGNQHLVHPKTDGEEYRDLVYPMS